MPLGRALTLLAMRLVSTSAPRGLNILTLADARFEVLGSPYSLLSVTLSASQKLYARRGTLVAVAGKPENVRPPTEYTLLEPR